MASSEAEARPERPRRAWLERQVRSSLLGGSLTLGREPISP
jgi:hypothetical protein